MASAALGGNHTQTDTGVLKSTENPLKPTKCYIRVGTGSFQAGRRRSQADGRLSQTNTGHVRLKESSLRSTNKHLGQHRALHAHAWPS